MRGSLNLIKQLHVGKLQNNVDVNIKVTQYNVLPPIKLSLYFSLNKTSHKTQTFIRGISEDGWSVGAQDLIHPDLLVGHPVDDAVISRVHVPQVVRDSDDGEGQSDHQPQHDVEHHSVLEVVLVGQVVRAAGVTLPKHKLRFKPGKVDALD